MIPSVLNISITIKTSDYFLIDLSVEVRIIGSPKTDLFLRKCACVC